MKNRKTLFAAIILVASLINLNFVLCIQFFTNNNHFYSPDITRTLLFLAFIHLVFVIASGYYILKKNQKEE